MELIERVAQADRNAAADILDEISSLTQDDGIGQVADLIRDGEYDEHDTVQRTARHRQAGVQQGLDMAAGVVEEGYSRWRDKSSATANKRESRDYETMAIACIHVAAAIRKLGGGDA